MLIEGEVAGDRVLLHHLPGVDELPSFRNFARSHDIFGLDVETTAIDESMGSFDPAMKLRLVQFGSRHEAWNLDPHDQTWRHAARTMLEGGERRFVSHTNYDPLWVRREFGINLGARSLDTYPMAALLYPKERAPKNLKSLSDEHIDTGLSEAEMALHALFKELAPVHHRVGKKLKAWGFTNVPLDNEVFARYSGLDAIYVRRLLDILADMLKREGMARLSRREQQIQRMATDLQIRGLRLDRRYTNDLLAEVAEGYDEAESALRHVFGFSPRSPKRTAWLEEHGAHFTTFTDTGLACLTKDTMPDLLIAHKGTELEPVFGHMVSLSERSNLLSNLRQILNAADARGFVHPRLNTQAAVTGRMSIVSPAMQTFKNPKNSAPGDIEKDQRLRGCFIAREGYVLVGADYDSQETRLAAAFSRDPALLHIVLDNLNMHDITAQMIFGDDYDAEQRFKAKTLDFAQQYGAGPKKIGAQLGLGYDEARALWSAWRTAYSTFVAWSEKLALANEVVNPWGRVVPSDPMRPYANGNYAIQSSGRDVLGDAIVRLDEVGWGGALWLPIHDEIILEVPEGSAERACAVLKEAMTTEVLGIPLTTEPKIIGTRWNETE